MSLILGQTEPAKTREQLALEAEKQQRKEREALMVNGSPCPLKAWEHARKYGLAR